MRIPEWCKNYTLKVNGKPYKHKTEKGYAIINRSWKQGDQIELSLEMTTQAVTADPRVKADLGKRAVQRGPVVYCVEEIDNPQTYDSATITATTPFIEQYKPELLGGIVAITAETEAGALRLIPYYTWDNRQPGRMKVWINEK